jgi:hypothetical protein
MSPERREEKRRGVEEKMEVWSGLGLCILCTLNLADTYTLKISYAWQVHRLRWSKYQVYRSLTLVGCVGVLQL